MAIDASKGSTKFQILGKNFFYNKISLILFLQTSSNIDFDRRLGNMTFNGFSTLISCDEEVVFQSKTLHSSWLLFQATRKYNLALVVPDPFPVFSIKEKHAKMRPKLSSLTLFWWLWNIKICSSQPLRLLKKQEITNSPRSFHQSLLHHWTQQGNPHIWPRERKWKIQVKEEPKP